MKPERFQYACACLMRERELLLARLSGDLPRQFSAPLRRELAELDRALDALEALEAPTETIARHDDQAQTALSQEVIELAKMLGFY